jgi:hypothetical protein
MSEPMFRKKAFAEPGTPVRVVSNRLTDLAQRRSRRGKLIDYSLDST